LESPDKIDVSELIDHAPLRAFQMGVCLLCGLALIMDGFDMQAIGYVAPAIVQQWKIPAATLGPVFGAAPLGVLVGSLLFSMLADKIGRRPVLIVLTLFFSVLTLLTARAESVTELLALRFLAGLGLGGIVPNGTALVGEYSPRGVRVFLMMLATNFFNMGAAFGGFVSAWLIPSFGWRSVFYFGGVVPLAVGALMLFLLPESLQFLVLRGKRAGNVRKWLRHIAPEIPVSDSAQFVVREEKHEGMPFLQLFQEGRAATTILLWVINFMNLLNVFLLASWLPTVMRAAGYSTSTAVLVGTTLQIGAVAGTFVLGWLIEQLGFVPVLSTCFAMACLNVALIGKPGLPLFLLFAVVFVAGWCITGAQPGVNALSAVYYPTNLRSTGIGWGLGIGRMGAIVGPILAGELIRLHWSSQALFLAAAIPPLITAALVLSLRWVIQSGTISAVKAEAMAR
jgi:AAHS family 4-hydroxybenzoate transporter-like MFS transporter